jgi:hypothetical protein|nr:MAG: capsid protein [Cressdnaviricota sp.]
MPYPYRRRSYRRGRRAPSRYTRRYSRRAPPRVVAAQRRMENTPGSLVKGNGYPGKVTKSIVRYVMEYKSVMDRGNSAVDQYQPIFSLNTAGTISDFAGLFDAYRIDRVTMEWIYTRPDAIGYAAATANALVPNLAVVADFDDASPFTATNVIGLMQQYETFMYKPMTHPISFTVVPHLSPAAYTANGVYAGNMNVGPQWVDMGSPAVQWYGIKYAFDTTGSGATGAVLLGTCVVRTKYEISLRSSR